MAWVCPQASAPLPPASSAVIRASSPSTSQKLEHGRDGDWNLNPRDLANLTRHLWSAWEQPVNWTTVSLAAPPEELDAPLLFVSGSRALDFDDGEIDRLRAYLVRGGTLLLEPSDGSPEFRASAERLVARLFPPARYPGFVLAPLAADHGVYRAVEQGFTPLPRLRGVHDGNRTVLFLSEEYLAADWQRDSVESDAFRLATNLLFYATDRSLPEGRFASVLPATPAAEPRGPLTVLPVVVSGRVPALPAVGRVTWAAEQAALAWRTRADFLAHVGGIELTVLPSVGLAAVGPTHRGALDRKSVV